MTIRRTPNKDHGHNLTRTNKLRSAGCEAPLTAKPDFATVPPRTIPGDAREMRPRQPVPEHPDGFAGRLSGDLAALDRHLWHSRPVHCGAPAP